MLDPVSLRLRLGVRSACLSAQRRKSRAQSLAPSQAALVGGLVIAAAWSGGAAVAQVGTLAVKGDLLPVVALAPRFAPPRPEPLPADQETKLRAEAEARRRAVTAAVEGLRGAAHLPGPAPTRGVAEGPTLTAFLTAVEQAADARIARAERLFQVLGVRSQDPSASTLSKASYTPAPAGDLGLGDSAAAQLRRTTERVRALQAVNAEVARLPVAAPLTNPVRTSGFGGRSDPFTGEGAFHAGQDFAGARMTPVLVSAEGTVSFVGQRTGYGNVVEVDHGGGYKTRYAHLAAFGVRVGQAVSLGDRLGGMGSTGRSTGTHLHYEVWVNGRVVNPERFLRAGQALNGEVDDAEPTIASHHRRGHVWRHYARRGERVRVRFGA